MAKTFTLRNPDWYESISETAKKNCFLEAQKYAIEIYPKQEVKVTK